MRKEQNETQVNLKCYLPGNRLKSMGIKSLALLFLICLSGLSYTQTNDSVYSVHHLSVFAGATNNGISFIPTFSFHAPSAIFSASVGNPRLSFEPDVRFTLDTKRGGFVFWWRYKLITQKRFQFNIGAHPAINIMPYTDTIGGKIKSISEAQKYLGFELVPNYVISDKVSVGIYYLQGRGFQDNGPRTAHFLTLNSNLSNLRLLNHFILQFIPQFYYLNVDKVDGFYFTNTLTLSRENFPIVLQSTINKTIKTNIPGSRDFDWNITLAYNFYREYRATH